MMELYYKTLEQNAQLQSAFRRMKTNAGPTAFEVDGKKYAGKIFLCDDLNQVTYNSLVSYFEEMDGFISSLTESM